MTTEADAAMATPPLRVRFVPGVMPGKWLRAWAERMPDDPLDAGTVDVAEQTTVLRDGRADMAFARLPIDRTGLHVIPLYEERPVVVVAKDHAVAAFEEVDVADLADEHLLQDPDDVPEWRDVATEVAAGTRQELPELTLPQVIELVAAGTGIAIVPLSLARLHHRKDVTHRPVTGVAPAGVGLVWREDADDSRIEVFVGIVRGRTVNSSRGRRPEQAPEPAAERRGGKQGQGRAGGAGRGGAGADQHRGRKPSAGGRKHPPRRGRR